MHSERFSLKKFFISFVLSCFTISCASWIKRSNVLIEASHDIPPDWLTSPPENDGRFEYFIGQSQNFSSETTSRKEALDDAIDKYTRYCGVSVKIISTSLDQTSGLDSQVLGTSVSRRKKGKQEAEAYVSSIKAKEWYILKYQLYDKQGLPTKTAWKTTVLVKVPVEEKARVQAFARELKEKRHLAAVRKVEGKLSKAAGFYKAAISLKEQKNYLPAWKNLKNAEQLVERVADNPVFYVAKERLEKQEQADLDRIPLERNLIEEAIRKQKNR
ncbi:MAG: hypothetical protein ACE5GM_11525, partial [bacterium]